MERSVLKELVIGAVAGAAATIPMSWAMELMHRLLPKHQRHPLPPREITERVLKKAGIEDKLGEQEKLWLSLAAHVGYGAAVGSAYTAAMRSVPLAPLMKGTGYGLAVWAGSYLGLLPGMGILSPATRHPATRNAVMIAAHLVYGTALAVFADSMEDDRRGHPHFLGAHTSLPRPEEVYA